MKKLIKECRSCGSEEYTGIAPCTCIYEEITKKEIDITRISIKDKDELLKAADILEKFGIPVFSSEEIKNNVKENNSKNYHGFLVFSEHDNRWGIITTILGSAITIEELQDAIDNHIPNGPFAQYVESKKIDKAIKEACEYVKNISPEKLKNINNKTMITANEANTRATKINTDMAVEELNSIETDILEAVTDGKFHVSRYHDLTDYTTEHLEELGYQIKNQIHHNEMDVTISWDLDNIKA